MPDRQEFDRPLRAVREVLDSAQIENAVVGGVAANRYRRDERATNDVDVLVSTFDGLRQVLERHGYAVESPIRGSQDYWLLRATKDGVGYDFCLAEVEIQKVAIANARSNEGVATVEDLVILKLIAGKDNRPKDIDDLTNIARSGQPIDLDYLADWSLALDPYFATLTRFRSFQEEVIKARKLNGPEFDGPAMGLK